MPPKATGAPAKRKAPAFKPPRPTTKVAKTSTKAAPQPRRKSAPAPVTTLLSSDDDDDDDDDASSAMEGVEAVNDLEPRSQRTEPPPTIPPNLLTKLLHHHFADPGTRIGKDANVLVGKYMETFVREAIARAAFERQEEADMGDAGGDFLEVEDLEKLAPQLLLDF